MHIYILICTCTCFHTCNCTHIHIYIYIFVDVYFVSSGQYFFYFVISYLTTFCALSCFHGATRGHKRQPVGATRIGSPTVDGSNPGFIYI